MKLRPSSVVEQLQCPRCDIRVDGFKPEAFRGIQECYKRRCGQHWWAMWLEAGEVRPQLVDVFGEKLAHDLMKTWSLPDSIERPAYWQLSLSRVQTVQIRTKGSSTWLRLVTTLHHLQSASLVSAGR